MISSEKLRLWVILLGLWLFAAVPQRSDAATPMVKTQAPGFYRMMLGDFEVTALNDGVVAYQTTQVLPKATLHGAGRLMANLRAAGYQPEQIDEIYITHLGPDHVGGLTLGTERAFPNAILRAPRTEVDIFLHPDKAPAWTRQWIPFWADLFAPYIKAGKFQSIEEDVVLTPGIRALATHGHAPGHTSWLAGISPFRGSATYAPDRDAIFGRRPITQFLIRIPSSFLDPQWTLPGCQRNTRHDDPLQALDAFVARRDIRMHPPTPLEVT